MREKEQEQSIYVLSEKTQSKMGIYSVDIKRNVFQVNEKIYVKIYTLKEVFRTAERKKQFYELLSTITNNRIRLSWFYERSDTKFTVYMFMTVFFEADGYDDAVVKAEAFESAFKSRITDTVHIPITVGKWINVLSYICMNVNGKMKELAANEFLGKRSNWHDLLAMNETNYTCYIARNFPNKEIELSELLEVCNGKIRFCMDFQFMTDEENRLLDLEISNKYNTKMDLPQKKVVNMSLLLMVSSDDKTKLEELENSVEDFFYENEVLLFSGSKLKNDIADTINALGLFDFHSMENVEPALFRSLLL